MSSYKRDDKEFRASVMRMADAIKAAREVDLRPFGRPDAAFDNTLAESAERINLPKGFKFGRAYNFAGIPACLRVTEPLAIKTDRPIPRRYKVAEAVGGLMMWLFIILAASGLGAFVVEAFIKLLAGI